MSKNKPMSPLKKTLIIFGVIFAIVLVGRSLKH